MKEKIINFGSNKGCIGVLTEPDAKPEKGCSPALLMWNAGVLHRVGPYRLYVDMARTVAGIGFPALRFDISGKGDSAPRRQNVGEGERSIQDIIDAMDFLTGNRGVERFVLLGLCSGADEAFPAAVRDPRVAGLILLDGFGYRTVGYYFHHYGPRLFKINPWMNFFKSNLNAIISRINEEGNRIGKGENVFVREFPAKNKAKKNLLSLLDRGARVLFVYSGGVAGSYYNYKGQFKDMFGGTIFGENLEVEYFEEASHTYTRLRDRKKLIAHVCSWVQNRFGTIEGKKAHIASS